jgi:hypothetical protein
VDIEILEDGCIKLIPVEAIPRHQLWAWTVESKQAIASLTDPRPSAAVETEAEADAVAKRWVGED